ncbi:MAG: VWA domain-containing protein [Granulicella sp.]
MRKLFIAAALILCIRYVRGQSVPATNPQTTIRSTSTLVIVPTMVTSEPGSLVESLAANDFKLTDNGVEQKVSLEDDVARQPLSVVVLMQTGCAASRQFASYAHLGTMLDYMMGSSAHRIALVTFDSQPNAIWDFTSSVEDLEDGFTHPIPGDDGAAILDAVNYGIDLLKGQPPTSRRILILLSQSQDLGSKAHEKEVVRSLGENNIIIYSVAFSTEKTWLKDQFTKPRHGNSPYKFSPLGPTLIGTFDLGTPLKVALSAMKENAASEIASLSGGESVEFGSTRDLEQQLGILANHIPNRYTLSFRPTSNQPGFHAIEVRIPAHPELHIAARTSYWSAGTP